MASGHAIPLPDGRIIATTDITDSTLLKAMVEQDGTPCGLPLAPSSFAVLTPTPVIPSRVNAGVRVHKLRKQSSRIQRSARHACFHPGGLQDVLAWMHRWPPPTLNKNIDKATILFFSLRCACGSSHMLICLQIFSDLREGRRFSDLLQPWLALGSLTCDAPARRAMPKPPRARAGNMHLATPQARMGNPQAYGQLPSPSLLNKSRVLHRSRGLFHIGQFRSHIGQFPSPSVYMATLPGPSLCVYRAASAVPTLEATARVIPKPDRRHGHFSVSTVSQVCFSF